MSLLDTVSNVTIDKHKARELLEAYREAKAPATDEDRAIMTAYREIARGRVVIQAAQSIRDAGWNVDGSPKLAITRADVKRCRCGTSSPWDSVSSSYRAALIFSNDASKGWSARFEVNRMPERPRTNTSRYTAIVPLIPLHLRPKAALSNYWILWEADWHRAPSDPLLLRKLDGDLWLVLAAWNLTSVERAVLERRVHS